MKDIVIGVTVAIIIWVVIIFTSVIALNSGEDMVNMNKVTDFAVNGDLLILYTEDGSSYYWER